MLPYAQNIPMLGIMLCVFGALCSLMLKAKSAKNLSLLICIIVIALSSILLAYVVKADLSFTYAMGHFPSPFGNELRAGPLEALLALCVSSVIFLSLLGGADDLQKDIPENKRNNYYIITNLLLTALLAIIYTNDLFTAYVFIEIITIGACSLIAIKPSGRTLVATMWYLIMSLVGAGLLLFSISMLYSITGHLLMPGLAETLKNIILTEQNILPLVVLTGLMCTGLGIKCALFPFHTWLPGAHSSATTTSSSILSGLVVKAYIILIIKVFIRIYGMHIMDILRITDILLGLGVIGLLYGSIQATKQSEIKGMLAYSSIAQIGYIFAAIGLNTPAGYAAACFQIITHALSKAMLFTAAGRLIAASDNKKDWVSLRGAGRRDTVAGIAFIVGALSMIGIPLLPGFMGKYYLATASLGTAYQEIIIFTVVFLGTLLNALYYLPALLCLFTQVSPTNDLNSTISKTKESRVALYLFSTICMFLGLFAQTTMDIIEKGLALFGM